MDTSDHELELALLTTLPGDGTPIGNTTILRQLGWDEPTYFRIRDGLTAIGSVRLGRGRGGAVARVAGVTTLAKAFLDTLPVDGSPVGNIALQRQLSWDDEIYRAVKESLVDAGITKTGRGYGGTVSLATSPSVEILEELGPPPNGDVTEMSAVPRRELDLYPSFEESLNNWARAQEWNDHIVRQVANQGRRATGGVWTRPDFVVIGYKKWDYTPGIVRDVETFELKPAVYGVEAVFETAAHSRFATKSDLAIERPAGAKRDELLARAETECQRFGIGLLTFSHGSAHEDWTVLVEAKRQEPDPRDLERFIEDQIPERDRSRIRKWF